MHKPMEAGKPADDAPSSPAPCYCACGEPTDASSADAAQANRTAVDLAVYWDVNGEPKPGEG